MKFRRALGGGLGPPGGAGGVDDRRDVLAGGDSTPSGQQLVGDLSPGTRELVQAPGLDLPDVPQLGSRSCTSATIEASRAVLDDRGTPLSERIHQACSADDVS